MTLTHETALRSRGDLAAYAHNAHLLFALETAFQIEDIHTVAADALTDGKYDKKCDVIYVNTDDELLVVAQGYCATVPKSEAPSNKASDLNTAAAWLFSTPLDQLPELIKSAATQVHEALKADQLRTVQFWYVHNLPESKNVQNELARVEATVKAALKAHFPDSNIGDVRAIEVGQNMLEEWYKSLQAPILVTDEFELTVPGGYSEQGADWKAFVTSVDGSWLYELYRSHGTHLFSANLRGYLGSRRTSMNINHGIKQTAEADASRFWVFNNGITALVHDYAFDASTMKMKINGFSIVNGAQTTGSIGSLSRTPVGVKVQVRIVKCSSKETIHNIIQFNNSQNPLISADFRSNDQIQRRLRTEFTAVPSAEYAGGRRGGIGDTIRRPANFLPSDTVAQALAAAHGAPHIAYHERSKIWLTDHLYSRFFNDDTTAQHIVWCYSLLKTIETNKSTLMRRDADTNDLPGDQREALDFLRRRGATMLLVAAISACIEVILNRQIANLFKVSFRANTSPAQAESYWQPIVEIALPFAAGQLSTSLTRGIDRGALTTTNIKNFVSMIRSTSKSNRETLETFGSQVVVAT